MDLSIIISFFVLQLRNVHSKIKQSEATITDFRRTELSSDLPPPPRKDIYNPNIERRVVYEYEQVSYSQIY